MANQKQNPNRNGNRPNQRSGPNQNQSQKNGPTQTKPGTTQAKAAPTQTTPPKATTTTTPPRPTPAAALGGERKLTPKQEAARRRAAIRRRNQMIVIGIIAVVAIAAVGIILYAVNQPLKFDSLPATQTADTAIPLDPGLTAIDQPLTMGATTAKVTVTEYADFQCPACKSFFETTQSKLENDYVKTGKIKYVFANYPFLDSNRPAQESHIATEAAYCAADQKRFWDYHDALYMNQLPENSGKLTPDWTKQLAAAIGLNKDQFNKCMEDRKYKNQANQDYQTAATKGINATPTLAINGQVITFNSYDDIKAAIDKALAEAK